MYRKIATAVVTALVLATASSAAIGKPRFVPGSEQYLQAGHYPTNTNGYLQERHDPTNTNGN